MVFRFFRSPAWSVTPADGDAAEACAALHATSFARGWSPQEFEALLADRAVIADLLTDRNDWRPAVRGFALSRRAVDEAEMFSIAVAPEARRRHGGSVLLDAHLKRLATRGIRRVVLEVDQGNTAARRLYDRFGFAEVGRRADYYRSSGGGMAVVLARPLVPTAGIPDAMPAIP
jgi:[ribosomal protein S18]-alanine N-acetyltransferase